MIVLNPKEEPKRFKGKLLDGTLVRMEEKPYGSKTFLFHNCEAFIDDKWVPIQAMKTNILYISREQE